MSTMYRLHNEKCVNIKLNQVKSVTVSLKVYQGLLILGPQLFSLYVNDLSLSSKSAGCQMYADDSHLRFN